LSEEKKQSNYSEYSCHELNIFLYFKDKTFFTTVIAPYIKNKVQKQFIDHWLLGSDLSDYALPRNYNRLNTFERIILGQRLPRIAAGNKHGMNEKGKNFPQDPEGFIQLFKVSIYSPIYHIISSPFMPIH
jgi:hypothetical protein